MDIISRPGMWMQGLTTKEPDDSMIQVAIAAVEEVFDWKKYLEENFPETYPAGYFERAGETGMDLGGAVKTGPGALKEGRDPGV